MLQYDDSEMKERPYPGEEEKVNLQDSSWVLEGTKEILVVYGFNSDPSARQAALAKAEEIQKSKSEHFFLRQRHLQEQDDACTATYEARPTVLCIRPRTDSLSSQQDEPVQLATSMWQVRKGEKSKPEVVEHAFGELPSLDNSYVLPGKDVVLIVHGPGSAPFLRHKARDQALSIIQGTTAGTKPPKIQVVELTEQEQGRHCIAEQGDPPTVKCSD